MRALGSESDYPSAKEMATVNRELRVPDLRIHSKTNPASQSYSSLACSCGWWWFIFLWFEKLPWISYARVVNSPVCLDQSESQAEMWCCCSSMRWMFSMKDLFICFLVSQTFLMSQTPITLFDRILSKEPIWGDFSGVWFLSYLCKIKLVRVNTVVRIAILICSSNSDSVLWFNCEIKLFSILVMAPATNQTPIWTHECFFVDCRIVECNLPPDC